MIQAAIFDIDGVLLGQTDGLDFPLPTAAVQERLQNLAKQIPISLCTVKAYFAVKPIIEACGIQNTYHVTDAGATIVHGVTGEIVTTYIGTDTAHQIITDLQRVNIYTEWYTDNDYFALNHENQLVREGRTHYLGREAVITSTVETDNISKIIAFPLNEIQIAMLAKIQKKYTDTATLHWGINPSMIPKEAAFFTNPAATKQSGTLKIAQLTNIPLSNTLALGDSANDWTFMGECGYVGTLKNGGTDLKKMVQSRATLGYVTPKTVEEDGLLDILDYFKL